MIAVAAVLIFFGATKGSDIEIYSGLYCRPNLHYDFDGVGGARRRDHHPQLAALTSN